MQGFDVKLFSVKCRQLICFPAAKTLTAWFVPTIHCQRFRGWNADGRINRYCPSGGTDLAFVRLFREATENMGSARHVVSKNDSKVDLLAAKAITNLQVTDDLLQIRISDIWLKVLIDDNEDSLGWIHTNEDFSAVGLPSGRPTP